MSIAKAGWSVIARSLVGAAAGYWLSRYPGLHAGGLAACAVGLAWALFAAFFFRDPHRPLPEDLSRIYSPGDGTVMSVEPEDVSNAVTIRIFLSIFNVHLQRAPCSGTVRDAEYFRGSFRAAMSRAARHNERCVIKIVPDGHAGVLVVEQIAGLIARRIECRVGIGDKVLAGERYGMIHFGSQVAVTLPADTRVLVAPGDRVCAGVTPIAAWTG